MESRTAKPHILVVDDDLRLQELLKRYLSEQGFNVSTASDTSAMQRILDREAIKLIVLDLMLPGESGLECCKRLRNSGNTISIIMLTAKGDEADRIVGLELGADDYLPKPFNPRELVARIQAVLRRQKNTVSVINEDAKSINIGPMTFDMTTRKLSGPDGPIPLSSGQYSLLSILVENAGTPMSRTQLLAALKDREYDGTDRGIDIQISRLRKLIEPDVAEPQYIQTVWGKGYMYVPGIQK